MSGSDALQVAPHVLGAFSSRKQGRSEARLLRQQSRVAMAQSTADEEAQRRQARLLHGAQAAALAQSGTGMDGSNEQIMSQSAAMAELDALNIRYRGQMESRGLLARAKAAKRTGNLSAGLELLKGGAALYAGG